MSPGGAKAGAGSPLDPELEALPPPRRPWRKTTFAVLGATAVASIAVAVGLVSPARYSLWSGPPRELGALTNVQLDPSAANTWVHAAGELAPQAVEYRRPLDPDRFRLVRAEGNPKLFVELRVPGSELPEHYVPPNSFVGRLVPLDEAGLRFSAVGEALATLGERPSGAWVLVDGEAPATARWTLGVIALFLGFSAFGVFGITRLLRPSPA